MEMINRAIEGASEFAEFQRKLLDAAKGPHDPPSRRPVVDDRRAGENRQQRRARIRAERKNNRRAARAAKFATVQR